MLQWPVGSDRNTAMNEAQHTLTSWKSEQRLARSDALVDRRKRVLFDVTALAREVIDWYPEDTDRGPGLVSQLLFASPYGRDLEAYTATRANVSLRRLAQGPGASMLRSLHLGSSVGSTEDWSVLHTWSGNHTLQHLAVIDEPLVIKREDFWNFCDEISSLRSLSLNHSGSSDALTQLAAHSVLSARLERFACVHCNLFDFHLDRLINNQHLTHLKLLDLRQNRGVTPDGVARLKAAPQFAQTEVLSGPLIFGGSPLRGSTTCHGIDTVRDGCSKTSLAILAPPRVPLR
jgi:hypothetical protein